MIRTQRAKCYKWRPPNLHNLSENTFIHDNEGGGEIYISWRKGGGSRLGHLSYLQLLSVLIQLGPTEKYPPNLERIFNWAEKWIWRARGKKSWKLYVRVLFDRNREQHNECTVVACLFHLFSIISTCSSWHAREGGRARKQHVFRARTGNFQFPARE